MSPGPRVGIIGTGFMGTTHAAAWHAIGATPSAFLDRQGADDALPRQYGAEVFTELDAFLGAVDVVDICAPTHLHADLALAAAAAGKPTLCEKPLSLDVAEGMRVIDAFDRASVPLQVAHLLRFSPEYRAVRDAVVNGEIGRPAVLRLSRLSFAPDRGADSWFADESRSGGLFFDLMIHDLDYARWVAGDVVSVYARSVGGAKDHGIAILKHASGAITHVEASWANPAPVFRTLLEVAGSRGMITFSSDNTSPLTLRLHKKAEDVTTGLGDVALAANPFEVELQHFLDVVAGARQPVLTALDGLAAVQLADAARRSARTGQPVSISPLGGGA
ncbi:Gfo/Idh/MocA family oxidoreductase [Planosporangium thailandense]|uniref:Gfo/Idh/MocA family protein n=1 Tax=Planosporangium thailandense TaxID=765197 RepID=UPI00197BCB1A